MDKDQEVDEISEALEQNNEEFNEEDYNQWEKAHQKYDNGHKAMLENMVNGLSASHALKTMREYNGALSKKGEYLDYDEWHALASTSPNPLGVHH